jgi:hypothetical protein
MDKVRSKDGTSIAFDRVGEGPPIILVVGAFNDRARRPAVCGSGHEHRVVERMGVLRLGTRGADPRSAVPHRRAQWTGFRGVAESRQRCHVGL